MLTMATWATLSRPGTSGLVALRLIPHTSLEVFAAFNHATRRRLLLIRTNHPFDLSRPLPAAKGFRTQLLDNPHGLDWNRTLQFELMEPASADIFHAIANDILTAIEPCGDSEAAFHVFLDRLEGWKRFLDELPAAGLTQEVQKGLFAELWFLREWLIPHVGTDRAVQAWAGPKSLAKDFETGRVAIEVKATISKQPVRFGISNELQLDDRGFDSLLLFALLLELQVSGGTSLPELVNAVREDLEKSPSAAIAFSDLLVRAGYTDEQASAYINRYSVRSHHFFRINDDFPRIVGADLRLGVGDVRYTVLHSACAQFSVDDEAAVRTIKNG